MSKGRANRKHNKQENKLQNSQTNYWLNQIFAKSNESVNYSNNIHLTKEQKWIAFILGVMVMSGYAIEAANSASTHRTHKSNNKNKHKITNGCDEYSLIKHSERYEKKSKEIAKTSVDYSAFREPLESFTTPGTICIEKINEDNTDSSLTHNNYQCYSDNKVDKRLAIDRLFENREISSSIYANMPDNAENIDINSLSFLFQANDELKMLFDHIVSLSESDPLAAAGMAHVGIIKYSLFDQAKKEIVARIVENYILVLTKQNLIFHPDSKKYQEAIKLSIDKNNPNFYVNYFKETHEKINNGKVFNADNLRAASDKCKAIKETYNPEKDCQKEYKKAETRAEECKKQAKNYSDTTKCLSDLDNAAITLYECRTHIDQTCINPNFFEHNQEKYNNCMNWVNNNWYQIGVSGSCYNSDEDAF